MRTSLLKMSLAAIVGVGCATSIGWGQETSAENSGHGAITVTAGQGGALRLPEVAPVSQSYALTGEASRTEQMLRLWQRQAGPRYRVGQAEITLPASR